MAIPAAPPLTRPLESVAQTYAALARADAEVVIDGHVAAAIREWRLHDATFWQRVRYRSRMIRSATIPRSSTPSGKA